MFGRPSRNTSTAAGGIGRREDLGASLYERFSSRGEGDFADKVLSALRYQFGGHEEKAAETKKVA